MSKLKPSATKKARNSAYAMKGSAAKNALRKITKHIKNHPNDQQAVDAKAKGLNTTRKKPNARLGWVQENVKDFLYPTPPSRALAQEVAQVISLSKSVARTSLTKTEQAIRKKLQIERDKRSASKAKQAS